jgi:hypothetical protein
LVLAISDGALKYFLAPTLRDALFANLVADPQI